MVDQVEPAVAVSERRPWLTPGVGGIGTASFLADVGPEVSTAMTAGFVTSTLGPAAALGLIEGTSEGVAEAGRFVGGALADDPGRWRVVAVGGYAATAVLIGTTTSVAAAGGCAVRRGRPAGCG